MADVFVFGSNRQGRHGAGAALQAVLHWGAVYGHPRWRQGDAYAIVTKELRPDWPPVTLREVESEIGDFLLYARAHPEDHFLVTRIGGGLAGFDWPTQIRPLFANAPPNVELLEDRRVEGPSVTRRGVADAPEPPREG